MAVLSRVPKGCLAWNQTLNINPPWIPTRLTVPSINNAAPDGSLTASILHEDATAASDHFLSYTIANGYGNILCLSAVAKAINRSWLMMQYSGFALSPYACFNVTAGTIGVVSATIIARGIVSLGSGWYRCYASAVCPNNTSTSPRFYIGEADDDITFNGLNQDSLYIWRPQISFGYVPEDIEQSLTTEVPRT